MLEEKFDEKQLEHLTHLILFGVDAGVLSKTNELDWLPPGDPEARVFDKDIAEKARAKGISVMVAIGGWGIDNLFKAITTETEARNLGKHIAKFARANGFDGVRPLSPHSRLDLELMFRVLHLGA